MTTIVANLHQMAADSLIVTNFVDFPGTKIERVGDSLLGGCGDCNSIALFMDWYRRGKPRDWPIPPEKLSEIGEFEVLELSPHGLFSWSSFLPLRVDRGMHAVGAGGQAAMAAMLCGKTPAEAIEIACEVCPSTTMRPIHVFDLVPAKRSRRRKAP